MSVARVVAALCAVLVGCGTDPAPAPDRGAPAAVTARRARFGTEADAQRVRYPVARFSPEGPFVVSLELGGAPSGSLELRWRYEQQEHREPVPLDGAARDGDATWVASTLPRDALPIGVHELGVFFEGDELGRFPFEVGPPSDAIASRVRSAQTARGATVDFHPVEPTDRFGPRDPVFLTGCGDFGRASWIGVQWRVAGEVDEDGTQRLTIEHDTPDTCFAFDFRPHTGWPSGEHEAVLLMNAREVGRYTFTVSSD